MDLADYQFELPGHLIASQPTEERTLSRLLVLGASGSLSHHRFRDLSSLLDPGDLLILNDTKVIPARLKAKKETGGRVEIFLERITGEHTGLAQVRASKTPAIGSQLMLVSAPDCRVTVTGRQQTFFELLFPDPGIRKILDRHGEIPLPPYIEREVQAADRARYQTVYARSDGSVAAPTAGLHFDQPLLDKLKDKGLDIGYVTLHVGAGTFTPIRTNRIENHRMHKEWFEVDEAVCDKIRECRARKGRVIAVGTTSVRSLESACVNGLPEPVRAETQLFVYPGYEFSCVDALLTNFHLPGSSLLMLVAAFTGLDRIMAAYQEAISHEYRFFSYGDAMLILPGLRQGSQS